MSKRDRTPRRHYTTEKIAAVRKHCWTTAICGRMMRTAENLFTNDRIAVTCCWCRKQLGGDKE